MRTFKSFLRGLGCVDDKYKTLKTGSCRGFKAPTATSLGYLPHPQKRAPDAVNKNVNQAQFGDLKRLFTAIDKLRAHKRIKVGTLAELQRDDHPWIQAYFHGPRARAAGIGQGGAAEAAAGFNPIPAN